MKEEESFDSNEEPDAIVELLFVEKDFNHEKTYEYNEGAFYDEIYLYFTGKNKNDDLLTFKELLPVKINSRAQELIYFEGRTIDLSEYKYGVLDENKTITEFNTVNDVFFKALKKTLKFLIVGKELDLEKFKDHKFFTDFYNFVYGLFDEDQIMDNIAEPNATVEYLFVEKAEQQIKAINDDQGYIMALINIFFSGKFVNNNLTAFKNILQEELNFSVRDSKIFKNKSVDLNDYKFYLIDNDQNATEFAVMDENFFEALMASLRNLVIVGKNFDLEQFKHHKIFLDWFEKYSNRF